MPMMKPIGIRNSTVVNVTGREYHSQPSRWRMTRGQQRCRGRRRPSVQSSARHQPGRIQTDRGGPDGPCVVGLVLDGGALTVLTCESPES